VEHTPAVCGGLGAGLGDAPVVGVARRQVFDLPEPKLGVVERRAQTRRCGCGAQTAAVFPRAATGPSCYGPRVRGAVVYLSTAQHLPMAWLRETMVGLLGVAIGEGCVQPILTQAAAALERSAGKRPPVSPLLRSCISTRPAPASPAPATGCIRRRPGC